MNHIQDLLDTKNAGWVMKTFKASAKTKDEIKQDAARDAASGKTPDGAEHVIAGARTRPRRDRDQTREGLQASCRRAVRTLRRHRGVARDRASSHCISQATTGAALHIRHIRDSDGISNGVYFGARVGVCPWHSNSNRHQTKTVPRHVYRKAVPNKHSTD